MKRLLSTIAALCAATSLPLTGCSGPRPGPSAGPSLADAGAPDANADSGRGPDAGIHLPDGTACSNAACAAANDGNPAICVKERARCVALLAAGCHGVEGPWQDEGAVILGQVESFSAQPALLATREINRHEAGLAPFGAAERRPLALLQCAVDPAAPGPVLTHLLDELRIPGIIGLGSSASVIAMSERTTAAGVLMVATAAGSPQITDMNDQGLVWRISPSHALYVPALAQMVSDLERTMRDAGFTGNVKVAMTIRESPQGLLLEQELMQRLQINGQAAKDSPDFKRIPYPDAIFTENDIAPPAAEVRAFGPHIMIGLGVHETAGIARLVEAEWTHPHRLEYVLNAPIRINELAPHDVPNAELASRFRGVSFPERTANYATFALRYQQEFGTDVVPLGAQYQYDAAYALAYAAAAAVATKAPLTGAALASGMTKLVPPGVAINVGPDDVPNAIAALARGESIDLEGATGNLDFDVMTGEPSAERTPVISWCAEVRGGRLEFLDAGQTYDREQDKLIGTFRCPVETAPSGS